jgi:hypothetical protein
MIAVGYEDGNGASRLRGDLLLKMAINLTPSKLSPSELCSQSTLAARS